MSETGVKALIVRECKRMISRPIYIFAIIVAPLFSVFFFISLMGKGLPTNLPIAVVDYDRSSLSRNLVRQLDAFPESRVELQAANFTEARYQMQEGNVYAIYVIPHHFMKEVLAGKQPKITFYTNNSFLIAGSLVFRDMKTVSVLISGAVNRQMRLAKGQNVEQIMAQLQPILIDTHAIGNPWLNYSVYLNNMLLPGVLGLMVMLLTTFTIGLETRERTTKQWLEMGRGSIMVSLFGKLIPYTILFSIVGIFMQMMLFSYSGFPLNSGIWPMALAILLFVLASQTYAVFMFGVLPNMRLGMSFASLIGVISFSIAGYSFPVFAMAQPLQWLSNIFPLRHYFLIYVDQALNGYSIFYSRYEYMALALFLLLPLPLLGRIKHALLNIPYKA